MERRQFGKFPSDFSVQLLRYFKIFIADITGADTDLSGSLINKRHFDSYWSFRFEGPLKDSFQAVLGFLFLREIILL